MDADFLSQQREKLLQKRRELQLALNLTPQDESSEEVKDPLDAAVTYANRELAARQAEQYRQLLQDVEDALERIADSTYGICQGSGEEIPRKRLEAIPWARYTAAYQEKIERGLVSE
ncbi:TraR/DksA family transcriptional regulator [Chloracidobacterium sp. D]|uniref:TraR/DksA family transcriptional regulator n=1 Tax=Chloracidobacterium sp. D TaxID=2821536 RepID=UPI001B8BF942|nr:TraR/DksA family transcriptional regulator [Chloracidobacterium sp. D]QUV80884.1 TraR/DksA family transcriptional regulator [Chloracidobacterium sp. D]